MAQFNVIMTAPALAAPAVRLLEAAGCAIHYMPPYPDAAQVAALVRAVAADAILCRQGRVDGTVMDASPRLRIVARHGVGMDEVDIPAAAARGLLLTRAPGSNTVAVAEHTMALLLALVKDFAGFSATLAAGGWRGTAQGRDVAGLRLGLIGFGAIGQAVAKMAAAFDLRVSAFDALAPDAAFGMATRAADLSSLLASADILSVHCPLTPETRHLVGAVALAALPQGAIVINTARGGIVDEAALVAAIDSGHIAGAGLDVLEEEPPGPDHPLRRHPRIVVTPHLAGVTAGSMINMGVMAAECIVATLTGKPVPPDRVVHPSRI